jgi:hypothetical protein
VQALKKSGPEQSEQVVEQWAQRIDRWHLALPSLLLLEVARPFSFIASQGLLLCQPFLSYLDLERQAADYASLLADRSNIDHLIARLEGKMATRSVSGEEED